ncbi:MAG: hypothetical protein ACRCVX_06840 [Shewanella sp.]
MANRFNAEQGVYVTSDKDGYGRTSRYFGSKWQDNTGHASPYMGFEERWHWQPDEEPQAEPAELPPEQKAETFSYLGIYEVVVPVDGSAYKPCACPTFSPVNVGEEYACQQICDGFGQFESLAECLQNHPNGPGGGNAFPPGYDGIRYTVASSAGLPAGIVHPDPEYGPCSKSTSNFFTAWTYSQVQSAERTAGNGNDLPLAMVVSGTLFTEGRPLPRIGSLPIINAGTERWVPYGSPVFIDFTAMGNDAELKEIVDTAAVRSRIRYDLYSGNPGDPLGGFIRTCTLDESTWPTRVIGLGLMGIAYGNWTNCEGEARYMFTLPNNYPGCHQAINANGEDTFWCGWGQFTNSQTGASTNPPQLPPALSAVNDFWSSDSCPNVNGGLYDPPPGLPPGQYDPDYANKELYYFRNGKAVPELLATINAGEPVRVLVSPQERQFVVTYGQKPEPFRQGPKNFCKALHISKSPAQAGIPVSTDASNMLDLDYITENIGQLNPFAAAALTNAPVLPSPLQIKAGGAEPWLFLLEDETFASYSVFMQNKLLANAFVDYEPGPLTISQMLFEQTEPFKPLFAGTKAFELSAEDYKMHKTITKHQFPPAEDAFLLGFGVNTSKKLKPE